MISKIGFSNILLIVVLAVVIGGSVYLFNPSNPTEEPAAKIDNETDTSQGTNRIDDKIDTSSWKTGRFEQIAFKYPPDWKIGEDRYATPAQYARGEDEVVGITVSPPNNASPEDSLKMGGRQFDCEWPGAGFCFEIYMIPIHSDSTNEKLLKTFDQIIRTISYPVSNQYSLKVTSPSQGAVIKAGAKYTVKWEVNPKLSKVSISINNASANRPGLYSIEVPNTGSYEITIPEGKEARSNSKEYGPFYIGLYAPDPITRGERVMKVYTGFSDIFFIESETGTPAFPEQGVG